jgi:hypothetical protein
VLAEGEDASCEVAFEAAQRFAVALDARAPPREQGYRDEEEDEVLCEFQAVILA